MENTKMIGFAELTEAEQMAQDGGVNWVDIGVTVGVFALGIAGAPAVAIGASVFGLAYGVTRGIMS